MGWIIRTTCISFIFCLRKEIEIAELEEVDAVLGKTKILPHRTNCFSSSLFLPPSFPLFLPSFSLIAVSFTCYKNSDGLNVQHGSRPEVQLHSQKGEGVGWGLIFSNAQNRQDCSGQRIMQTSFAGNELQNTFIFYYSETLIKSQLLRSYSISGGITVFRTPLLMQTTSQSKRMRAPFPDANDLILSYLAVYI